MIKGGRQKSPPKISLKSFSKDMGKLSRYSLTTREQFAQILHHVEQRVMKVYNQLMDVLTAIVRGAEHIESLYLISNRAMQSLLQCMGSI